MKSNNSIAEERALQKHLVFIEIAKTFGTLSKANRKKQGCVIVNPDGRIISTGWNGTPHSVDDNCEDDNNVTLPYVIHAEINAVLNATTNDLSNCTVYITQSPCISCAAVLLQKRISKVYYAEAYRLSDGIDFLEAHGVSCHLLNNI